MNIRERDNEIRKDRAVPVEVQPQHAIGSIKIESNIVVHQPGCAVEYSGEINHIALFRSEIRDRVKAQIRFIKNKLVCAAVSGEHIGTGSAHKGVVRHSSGQFIIAPSSGHHLPALVSKAWKIIVGIFLFGESRTRCGQHHRIKAIHSIPNDCVLM